MTKPEITDLELEKLVSDAKRGSYPLDLKTTFAKLFERLRTVQAKRDAAVARAEKAEAALEPQVTITRTQFLEIARQVWENDFDRTREHPEQFTLKLAEAIGLGEPSRDEVPDADLRILAMRLTLALKRYKPDRLLVQQAEDYLARTCTIKDMLRDEKPR